VLSNTSGTNTGDQSAGSFNHNDLANINAGTSYQHISTTEKTNYGTAYSHSQLTTGNPHSVTKSDVGLGNVPNVDATNADNISDGTTKAIITLTQESNFETAYSHTSLTNNPHTVTKTQVGLGNVANVDTTNAYNISDGTQ
jgi:hypothetical protein